jgi:adenylate cyclase
MSSFGNYRRDLSVLETSGGRSVPQIQNLPPTAASPNPNPVAPWMSSNNGSPVVPSSAFGTTFYNDSSDNLSMASQLSPGFRPSSGNMPDDDRRPSVASVTTASSSGSKSSVVRTGIHKSLKGFFGDEFPGSNGKVDAKEGGKEPNTKYNPEQKDHRSNSYTRNRNPSTAKDAPQRDSSPVPSRPRTPVPSSDVVPFLYQDSQVSTYYLLISPLFADMPTSSMSSMPTPPTTHRLLEAACVMHLWHYPV